MLKKSDKIALDFTFADGFTFRPSIATLVFDQSIQFFFEIKHLQMIK